MKDIKNSKKTSFFKRLFIKICRKLGYEIIDQNSFELVTSNKILTDDLSKLGLNSINLPLGEVKVTRKVKALDIIVRTCASVNMLTQNKTRLFEEQKIEYTLRTIRSLLHSANFDLQLKKLKINFKVIDHNSTEENLKKIDDVFKKFNTDYKIINLDVSKFKDQIDKTNQRGETVTSNQMSNMANIHQSLLEAKKSEDLIYFVEDDYLHFDYALEEMIGTYERISSQLGKDLFICPADYPFLYMDNEKTNLLIGNKRHWRTISKTLCTFMTSKEILDKYWEKFYQNCLDRHDPFEKHLNEIYKKEVCISPVKSLSIHITNVNSSYGLSPFIDYKKLWEENE